MRALAALFLLPLAAPAQNPLMLENEWVRVVMGATVPGQLSRPHVHKINRVMIHLDRGAQRIANLETKTSRDIPFVAGQVRWDPRVGLHTSENIGGTAFKIVEVELNDNPPRPAPAKLGKAPYKVELDNPQVRVLRATLKPGEKSPAFATPILATRLPDGDTHFHAPGGAPVENTLAQASDWIIVELK